MRLNLTASSVGTQCCAALTLLKSQDFWEFVSTGGLWFLDQTVILSSECPVPLGVAPERNLMVAVSPSARFPQTAWTCIQSAQDPGHPRRVAAIRQLITTYWKPVFPYLRAIGQPAASATSASCASRCEPRWVPRTRSRRSCGGCCDGWASRSSVPEPTARLRSAFKRDGHGPRQPAVRCHRQLAGLPRGGWKKGRARRGMVPCSSEILQGPYQVVGDVVGQKNPYGQGSAQVTKRKLRAIGHRGIRSVSSAPVPCGIEVVSEGKSCK
jgi:hypothetical protein